MTNQQGYSIYPKELIEIVENSDYIPRRIKDNEHLLQYHRYWSSFYNFIYKITDIYHIDSFEYYSVKYQSCLFAEISFPVAINTYELYIDYNNILNKNIINNKHSFLGCEIKYWFYKNNIDLTSTKYKKFLSFIDRNSKSCILDNKYYYIVAEEYNGKYRNCKFIIDRNRRNKYA